MDHQFQKCLPVFDVLLCNVFKSDLKTVNEPIFNYEEGFTR